MAFSLSYNGCSGTDESHQLSNRCWLGYLSSVAELLPFWPELPAYEVNE
jgi:hypothetical protein